MTKSAILFDFDGVLVESADIKIDAFMRLFADAPQSAQPTIRDFLNMNVGLSRFAKCRYIHSEILHDPLDDEGLAVLSTRFSELVMEAVIACPAVPGAEAFLQARSAEMPLFLVSATPEAELNTILKRRGMEGWFRATRGSPRAKTDNVRDLLTIYGLDPSRTLLIGDSQQDLKAATDNGLRFVGRVPEGVASPFPEDAFVVQDLHALATVWSSLNFSACMEGMLA